jgi:hypothetical protein
MPNDYRASESVPVLATAPFCDRLSGASDRKWSHSEHSYENHRGTLYRVQLLVVADGSSRAEPGHLGVPGHSLCRDIACAKCSEVLWGRTSSLEVLGVDSVVYRTAAAADILSSRSICVRSAFDHRHAVQVCKFPRVIGGRTHPRHKSQQTQMLECPSQLW